MAGLPTLTLAETKEAADQAIAAANDARKKAASVGGEWRDTGKMIKEAQAAAEAGDFAKAVKLAGKAEQQGKLGYEQAMNEKDADLPAWMK
jgi:dihydrodipicolinate synthase/N-acetylneuraminate lyase